MLDGSWRLFTEGMQPSREGDAERSGRGRHRRRGELANGRTVARCGFAHRRGREANRAGDRSCSPKALGVPKAKVRILCYRYDIDPQQVAVTGDPARGLGGRLAKATDGEAVTDRQKD